MDQITLDQVLELCQKNGFELKSTHSKLCLPIINRLYKKMTLGIQFPYIRVDEGVIIDGHHRYLASLLAGYAVQVSPSSMTAATVITDWKSVEIVAEDWDKEEDVEKFNRQDARLNGMSYEEICILLE